MALGYYDNESTAPPSTGEGTGAGDFDYTDYVNSLQSGNSTEVLSSLGPGVLFARHIKILSL